MHRGNLKFLILCVGIFPLLLTVYNIGKCNLTQDEDPDYRREVSSHIVNEFDASVGFQPRVAQSYNHVKGNRPVNYEEIECVINGDYSVEGRKEGNEVYMPFSFIQNYFEVYGSIETSDGYERFSFHHSYQDDFPTGPQPRYSPSGVFMSFDLYSVEDRNRVKCVSGIEGVPISTQWERKGHYYPIQIAQYGLSHYSKHLSQPRSKVKILEDGEQTELSDWLLPDRKSEIRSRMDDNTDNGVVEFKTATNLKNPGITKSANEKILLTLSMDIMFINNGSVTVLLQTGDGNLFRIHYILSDNIIKLEGKDLYYGIGSNMKRKWIHLTRQVMVDFQKGLTLQYSKNRSMKMKSAARIAAICVRGHGIMDNVSLSFHAHKDLFLDAANYFVRHQDSKGGWPVKVTRKLIPEVMELEPGWYSAMGQGQAISLLVRAYVASKNNTYLEAAGKALDIFDIPSSKGGVLAKFLNSFDWYEEYPTTPSSFVLNGFIYSLIGLYDLKQMATSPVSEKAAELYNNGMRTLKAMLPMFDSGTGTFYDLRHITAGLAPNRARWDYHKVHIKQLYLLVQLDSDPLFKDTLQRWKGYMKGNIAPHN
ncbi:D-glucuronyl C5-epimerase B-like [Crassostrea angulata]|uniref:D-glucuronyl C5-epimerase B-like n=1 Tax=Magallana angulata TaxID=2784310 RepID=UPI0022B0D0CA|nr:D-glucuronyl C5-epimerase B-like [Crassostrea angulata]XP_052716125.1 D-glucuronyl C5-epimerase B-like [Crassostrea angulata]XP_052716126.1 D-glucuronyl C5-epimerase B-like [Crassostrea angulata]XP_052716127.1 D-glucuronyl C5-epimerase B-like [Crassostrea angulata]XP_052716128.1 D-glucuronyl C5-epimerase B-like [Crassostrea angulata]XP_052716129.1 D-glucuronyl C5-epimerase B-like [Crassostrea angulata]XP_052716130.1 D-glucuronyl C5-epimerase B-like [Crassostrea angulata]XP_052716131.1 D-g